MTGYELIEEFEQHIGREATDNEVANIFSVLGFDFHEVDLNDELL